MDDYGEKGIIKALFLAKLLETETKRDISNLETNPPYLFIHVDIK
jgi:hypothetical protein